MSEFLTNDFLPYSPHPPAATLTQWFEESSQITQHIFTNLHAGDELVPQLHILNPPLWEFGHLTWFHEFWVHRGGQVSNPPFMVDADYLFNSSEIAHQDRWSTPMPSLDSLLEYNLNVMSSTDPYFSPSNRWLGNDQAKGHCGDALKDHKQAAALFEKFAATWPQDERAPDALEAQADNLKALKATNAARDVLLKLSTKYPASDAGKRAKQALKSAPTKKK